MRLVGSFLVFCLMAVAASAAPQSLAATVSGTVITEDGVPLRDVSVRWNRQGQSFAVATDAYGKFSFDFSEPGMRTLRFEHPSTVATGTYNATLYENASIDLSVVLYRNEGGGAPDSWSIKQEFGKPPVLVPAERVISADNLDAYPGTQSLWSFLSMSEPSVVAERFDISGLHSYRQLLIGVRGSSWTQNHAAVGGLTITNPSGEGILAIPDMSAMEAVVYSIGGSATRHTGPGAHIELIPKVGTSQPHGQARFSFQSGALQNTNVIPRYREFGITQSDERWKRYLNGGFQLQGPLGKSRWTYFTALSAIDADKWIRNHESPVSGTVLQETVNVFGELSLRDRFTFHSSLQQRREPQAEASPQVTRDSSIRQSQNYRQTYAAWTHAFGSGDLLEVRGGTANTRLNARAQTDAIRQSEEELFPGYVVDGIFPRQLRHGEQYEMMWNTRRGTAPLVSSGNTALWEGAVNYSTVRQTAGIHQRIASGLRFNDSSITQADDVLGGLNLFFFHQAPYSVRFLNTPSNTRDRIRQFELYASDTFSLSRLSFSAGVSANLSRGANVLSSGESANRVDWSNIGGNLGAALQITQRRPLVVRAATARIYDHPTTNVLHAVNPEGIGSRTFLWTDVDRDGQFQVGEATQLLKVSGAPYTRMDPLLKNPVTSEFTAGVSQGGLWRFTFEASAFRRTTQQLMSMVNEGVPFSSYKAVQAIDYGSDAHAGTSDDQPITVFNQGVASLGKDRYVLTNPEGFSSHSEGLELKLQFASHRVNWEAAVTRYRAVASTAPGLTAEQNDTSAFAGVFDDPNKAIFARGSTFFDRGTLGRFRVNIELPWQVRGFVTGSYQDGLPYSRLMVIEGLNQGLIAVRTVQRGPGEANSQAGSMTQHYETIDMRLARSFAMGNGRLTATLDVFNVRNLALATVEGDVTSPIEKWRFPVRFQTPRSIQLGLRYDW